MTYITHQCITPIQWLGVRLAHKARTATKCVILLSAVTCTISSFLTTIRRSMGKKKLKQPEKKTFSEYHQLEDLKGYVGTVDIKHKHPVTEMHPTLAPLCSESAESIWTTMFDSSGVTPTSIEHSPDVPSLSPLFR